MESYSTNQFTYKNDMFKYLLVLVCFIVVNNLSAQLIDDFDDVSFPSDPTWIGDVGNFIVNDLGELQLNAVDGGVSTILSAIDFQEDTLSFGFKFKMDFNPSGSNKLRIYLAIDNEDVSIASGYLLELGETGSEDAIRVYRLSSGIEFQIATATLGAVSTSPDVNVNIEIYPDGLWVMKTDYSGGNLLEEELLFTESSYDIFQPGFFGFGCTYTSSRSDLYFFDDVSIREFELDQIPPTVDKVQVQSSTEILVTFSEPVDEVSAQQVENYRLSNGDSPTDIASINPTELLLTFANVFSASAPFDLTVSGVADQFENTMPAPELFTLNFARKPVAGDIVINEILFAALLGEEDYVEIFNTTTDFLDLSGYVLGNNTKTDGDIEELAEGTVIDPLGYLAFSERKIFLVELYEPQLPDNIVEQDIPSYNNDSGNVFLADQNGNIIDSYDYNEDQHFELLGIVKGVSLERVSPTLETNGADTWTSASQDVNFGTPGYQNSASLPVVEIEENFEFVQKVFSPDADNVEDNMVLGYNLDKSGYVANIEVRDIGGYRIKSLKRSETLSSSGLITWNGLDEEGKVANIGMYIVVGEVFHPDGEVIRIKKVCVLAGQLN